MKLRRVTGTTQSKPMRQRREQQLHPSMKKNELHAKKKKKLKKNMVLTRHKKIVE